MKKITTWEKLHPTDETPALTGRELRDFKQRQQQLADLQARREELLASGIPEELYQFWLCRSQPDRLIREWLGINDEQLRNLRMGLQQLMSTRPGDVERLFGGIRRRESKLVAGARVSADSKPLFDDLAAAKQPDMRDVEAAYEQLVAWNYPGGIHRHRR